MTIHYLPGPALKSSVTGRIYNYTKDADGSSKRAAIAQLEADERGYAEKPKRPPAPPDTRSHREVAISEMQANKAARPQTTATVGDGLTGRLEQLRRDLAMAMTKGAKEKIKRRIAALEQRLADFGDTEAAKAERAALFASDEYRAALQSAEGICTAIDLNTSLDESYVTDSRHALQELKMSGDHVAYRQREDALKARYQAHRDKQFAGLKEQQDAIAAQVEVFKSAESIDASSPRPNPGGPTTLFG